jgi:hypothetical protein
MTLSPFPAAPAGPPWRLFDQTASVVVERFAK